MSQSENLPLDRDLTSADIFLKELRELQVGDRLRQVSNVDSAWRIVLGDEQALLLVQVLVATLGGSLVHHQKLSEILHICLVLGFRKKRGWFLIIY